MASVPLLIDALIPSHQSLTFSKSMSKPTQTSVETGLIKLCLSPSPLPLACFLKCDQLNPAPKAKAEL